MTCHVLCKILMFNPPCHVLHRMVGVNPTKWTSKKTQPRYCKGDDVHSFTVTVESGSESFLKHRFATAMERVLPLTIRPNR